MFGYDIGIDLGTATVLIYIKGKGIVLQEPSVVAIDSYTKKVLRVGLEAQEMLGRTPGSIEAIRPLRDGVISDFEVTAKMLKYFIKKVCGNTIFKPRVVVCIPSIVTEVENRAVLDAAYQAGAKWAEVIEEPKAAAMGAGIDISKPNGNLIVDIGGGTSDVAVISFGDIVNSRSVKIAGDKFDEAIVKHIRKNHNVLIGDRTAEDIKIKIGCMVPRESDISMEVKGRCLLTGLPKNITVYSSEIMECLLEPAATITEAIHAVLEETPPELVGDISVNGVYMTGGGSLVYGFDKYISGKIGIDVRIADDPVCCVAKGTGYSLEYINVLRSSGKNRLFIN
ncbi:MAG: MreB/Mrl family cell shape determining protein [Ruminococcaceae bacterium]|nr:MreB/Mrl family cell shape determining protein [Oscillospiraceae bacterium]